MIGAKEINNIFIEAIKDFHIKDDVNQVIENRYSGKKFEELLYLKNWIDTVQWHLEDIIRDPKNEPSFLVEIKQKIDKSNQYRTDTVEQIDEYIYSIYTSKFENSEARINSETPAWLLDRMSILQLKIYHFKEQLLREDIDNKLITSVTYKLNILLEQEKDLANCFDELIEDFNTGNKKMKLYKQMKMYNDPNLNPVFYKKNHG